MVHRSVQIRLLLRFIPRIHKSGESKYMHSLCFKRASNANECETSITDVDLPCSAPKTSISKLSCSENCHTMRKSEVCCKVLLPTLAPQLWN